MLMHSPCSAELGVCECVCKRPGPLPLYIGFESSNLLPTCGFPKRFLTLQKDWRRLKREAMQSYYDIIILFVLYWVQANLREGFSWKAPTPLKHSPPSKAFSTSTKTMQVGRAETGRAPAPGSILSGAASEGRARIRGAEREKRAQLNSLHGNTIGTFLISLSDSPVVPQGKVQSGCSAYS